MLLDILKRGEELITELAEITPFEKIGNFVWVGLQEVYVSGFFQDIFVRLLG
jgi:hypothetical protein